MRTQYRLEVKRRKVLFSEIREKKASNKHLELIAETDESKKEKTENFLNKIGQVTRVFEFVPYISFTCEARDAERFASQSVEHVKSVDLANRVSANPTDIKRTNKSDMWNLEEIGAFYARKVSTGEGAKVAIIDSGIDYTHGEVASRFSSNKGHDFVNNYDPMDENGHGTHVAGIVAGSQCGVATNCTLYALRVLDADGSGSESDTMAALEWCLKNDVDIANMSLGSPLASRAFEDLCYYAANKGLILVAAAGNDQMPSYPAAFDDPVISVSAVDRGKNHAYFSNIYYTNDVCAPGVDIVSSYPGGYASLSGTSMASPHVAGSLALAVPLAKNDSLEYLLEDTAEKLGNTNVFGAGLVRADTLIDAVKNSVEKKSLIGVVKDVLW
ncbi:MAG: S8 family peptidase [bacterium]|nr:S8 family peptidase [bacterium]